MLTEKKLHSIAKQLQLPKESCRKLQTKLDQHGIEAGQLFLAGIVYGFFWDTDPEKMKEYWQKLELSNAQQDEIRRLCANRPLYHEKPGQG